MVKTLIRRKIFVQCYNLLHNFDNIITIVTLEFQTLVTSITVKRIHVSGKNSCFEIINEINEWRIRDTNVIIVVYMV